MSIAVIIPVFDEQEVVSSLINALVPLSFQETIIVDGNSADGTTQAAKTCLKQLGNPNFRIILGPRGRAMQMNMGAAQATADILLFLHADTQLPRNAKILITEALSDSKIVGGRFDVRFPQDTGYAWLVSRMMNLRSRLSGMCTGDQAIFVRRSIFESMGGFAEIPLMEDLEFSRRLKRRGKIVAIQEKVITSFRRWEQQGPLRTILQMWTLRFLYWIGWDPHRLQQFYHHVR